MTDAKQLARMCTVICAAIAAVAITARTSSVVSRLQQSTDETCTARVHANSSSLLRTSPPPSMKPAVCGTCDPNEHVKVNRYKACGPGVAARLLITGCGRSGTHAVAGMLNTAGIPALHEAGNLGPTQVLVSWPATAYVHSAVYWRVGCGCFEPVIKVHREPLAAISSLANSFSSEFSCLGVRDQSDENVRYVTELSDALSWSFANQFVALPFENKTKGFQQPYTCELSRSERILLALHYWIGWNELGDRIATYTLRTEDVTAASLHQLWCDHCQKRRSCACAGAPPEAARGGARSRSGHNSSSVAVHGKRLSWAELSELDVTASRRAAALARVYGYGVAW